LIGDSYSDTSLCPPSGDQKSFIGLITVFSKTFHRWRSEEKENRVKKERREKDVVMEIPLDVVMEKTSLEEKTSLSTQFGPPVPETWASRQHDHHGAQSGDGLVYVFERLQACIRGYRRYLPSDLTPCSLLQEIRLKMDEDLEKRVIETMPVVNSLCFHTVDTKYKSGYHVNLRCDCGATQVGPILMSSKRPTPDD
jgi:hypothetical protein